MCRVGPSMVPVVVLLLAWVRAVDIPGNVPSQVRITRSNRAVQIVPCVLSVQRESCVNGRPIKVGTDRVLPELALPSDHLSLETIVVGQIINPKSKADLA